MCREGPETRRGAKDLPPLPTGARVQAGASPRSRGRRATALVALLGAGFGTCSAPDRAPPLPEVGIPVVELERFRVLDRDRLVGYLVLVELQRPGSPLRFYQVRTPGAGRVGRISLDGRFLRWEPFRDEPRDLGLFPMKQGLAHLFELDAPPIILPVEGRGQPTEASAHRLIEQALARPSPAPGSRPTRTPTRPR